MLDKFRQHTRFVRGLAMAAIALAIVLQSVPLQARGEMAVGASIPQPYLTPAIVYMATGGHMHEITLRGTWQDRDLTSASGDPHPNSVLTQPVAFRRSDGISMVVYRDDNNHIKALYLELLRQPGRVYWQEVWHWADLTAIAGSALAATDPFGYVRGDGVNAVVYVGMDGHVHELWLGTKWTWADLTAIAGSPLATGMRPFGYVRGDGTSTVVYQSAADHVIELRLDNTWLWADLTTITGATLPSSSLSAYVRSDGYSIINYAGTDGHVHELRLETSWMWGDPTAISGSPLTSLTPYGYVRSDGMNTIVYATYNPDTDHFRIIEQRLENAWQWYEMTSVQNAVRGYMPVGYVRSDGISCVVYLGLNGHIQEIRLGTTWIAADLTNIAGAPNASSGPWPYNRSIVSKTYLPLIRR
jgi:hypothetical protein